MNGEGELMLDWKAYMLRSCAKGLASSVLGLHGALQSHEREVALRDPWSLAEGWGDAAAEWAKFAAHEWRQIEKLTEGDQWGE